MKKDKKFLKSLTDEQLASLRWDLEDEQSRRNEIVRKSKPEPLETNYPNHELVGFFLVVPFIEYIFEDVDDFKIVPDIREDLKRHDLHYLPIPDEDMESNYQDPEEYKWIVPLEYYNHVDYRSPGYGLNWEANLDFLKDKKTLFERKYKKILDKYKGSYIIFGAGGDWADW